jgi:hypothetical protein
VKPSSLPGFLAALSFLLRANNHAFAQGSAFSYQGRLNDGTNPASGIYDLRFAIYDGVTNGALVGGPLTNSSVKVTSGLLTLTLDFGSSVFDGSPRWLEVGVRTNGSFAPYVNLSPRQALTATPFAVRAANFSGPVAAGQIIGAISSAQLPGSVLTNGASGVSLAGTFSGNGAGLTNLSGGGSLVALANASTNIATVIFANAGNNFYYYKGTTNISGIPCPYYTNATSSVLLFDQAGALNGTWTIGTLAQIAAGDANYFGDTTNLTGTWSVFSGNAPAPTLAFFGLPAVDAVGYLTGNGRGLTNLNLSGQDAANITSGTLDSARLPAGGITLANFDNQTFLDIAKGLEPGMTFSNVNRFAWNNTYNAIRAGQAFTVLRVGDGLADNGMLANAALYNLTNLFPLAGFAGSSKAGGWGIASVSGAAAIIGAQVDPLWFKSWAKITNAGGIVQFGDSVANIYGVHFVAEPGAGHFDVQTSPNGSAWTTVIANVDANNSTQVGRSVWYTNSSVGLRAFRVVGTDAGSTIKILDASVINSTIPNGMLAVDWIPTSGPGSATLGQILSSNLNVTGPIMAAWNPRLILFQKIGFKNAAGDGTNLVRILEFWRTNNPNADVVLCGNYPVGSSPANDAITNAYTMRTNAMARGLAFFDGWAPFIDATNMFNRGWGPPPPGVHATPAGYAAYDNLLTDWLELTPAAACNKTTFSAASLFQNGIIFTSNTYPITAWAALGNCGCATWMSNATLYLICTNSMNLSATTNRLGGL